MEVAYATKSEVPRHKVVHALMPAWVQAFTTTLSETRTTLPLPQACSTVQHRRLHFIAISKSAKLQDDQEDKEYEHLASPLFMLRD